jgi:hypothetical protein
MIRRFFRWLWSLTPWGRPKPTALPEPDNSPRLFHIPAEADWPFDVPVGSLCIMEGNDDWLGGLYQYTGEMGWVQVKPMEPLEPHDAV